MSEQPNFLYIITDQHRADYLGCYGHPILRTPHIDSLAKQGSRFDNFHVASPVCMPNRASLLTGRFPSIHGLRRNGLHLPTKAYTFADVLKTGGYDTAMIGKSHIQPFTGKALDSPYADAPIPEAVEFETGNWLQEDPQSWEKDPDFWIKTPFYGFDHVDVVTRHSDACAGNYYQWLSSRVEDPESIRGPQNQLPHDYICPQAFRTAVPEELHPTFYIRDQAQAYLADQQRQDKPFFAFVSFPDPHHPFSPPGKYWDMYDPDDFRVDLPYGAHQNPPPHLQYQWQSMQEGRRRDQTEKGFMANEREIQEAMALTCGMITMIDDSVGTLLETIRESGLDKNTVVIFNTDHGDYMGDFNLLLKGPEPSRAVTRVPFIWHDPTEATLPVVDGLASTTDIASTILDRAGLMEYNGIHGQSLMPLMREGVAIRENLLIEHEDNTGIWGFEEPAESRTLISNQYRMTIYRGQSWGELYDLENDPEETRNLWDNADYQSVQLKLVQELTQRMIDITEKSPWPRRFA